MRAADGGGTGVLSRTLTVGSALTQSTSEISVLISLDPQRIDYGVAGASGENLAFFDSSGDRLPHDIAAWNPQGLSQVWVRLAALDPATTLTMRYGDLASPVQGHVWSDHGLVAHFEGDLSDSSPAGLALGGRGGSELVGSGFLGGGVALDGVDDYIEVGVDLATFNSAPGATLSAWIRMNPGGGGNPVLEFSNTSSTSSRIFLSLVAEATPACGVLTGEVPSATEELIAEPISAADWHWVVCSADLVERTLRIFADGRLAAEVGLAGQAASFGATNTAIATIGRNDTSSMGFLPATLDEVRAAPVAVDEAWVLAAYLSMTDSLFVFGADSSGLP